MLSQFKMNKQYELLLSKTEEVLGVDFTEYHVGLVPKEDVQKASKMIADKDASIDVLFDLPFIEQIRLRSTFYNKMKCKYKNIPFSRLNSFVQEYKPIISYFIK